MNPVITIKRSEALKLIRSKTFASMTEDYDYIEDKIGLLLNVYQDGYKGKPWKKMTLRELGAELNNIHQGGEEGDETYKVIA